MLEPLAMPELRCALVALRFGRGGGVTRVTVTRGGTRGAAGGVTITGDAVGGVTVDRVTEGVSDVEVASAGVQPTGGTTCTMLEHFGHVRICPMTDSSRTFKRARQVVHWIAKCSTGDRSIQEGAGADGPNGGSEPLHNSNICGKRVNCLLAPEAVFRPAWPPPPGW